MTSSESSEPDVKTIPRWTIPWVWALGLLTVYGILPWALSRLGPNFGWTVAGPGRWNWIGLGLTAASFCLLLWCLSLHFARYSERVPMDPKPRFLLNVGPYKVSRNPMYMADIAILLGWSVFYGTVAVLLGAFAFAAFLAFVLVPSEERHLQARFGTDYLNYTRQVPRWLGRRRS